MARMSSSQAPTSIRQSHLGAAAGAPASAAPSPPVAQSTRIPATLQSVFLASNRGKTVHKPPPEKVASKTFFRNWLFQKQSNSSSRNKNHHKSNGMSSSITATMQRSYKGLWSFGGYNNNNNSTNSGNNTNARNSTPPTTGRASPISARTTHHTNGSKYKMASSKKQTDALVTAAIAAAERLSQQQELHQQQPKVQQTVAAPSSSTPASTPQAPTTAPACTSSVSPSLPPAEAPVAQSIPRAAAEVVVTDLSETEEQDSPSSSSSSVASPSMTTTPVASIPATPKEEQEVSSSPQDYLDSLLESRGYSTRRFQTLQTAYYNKPTPLQTASYHVHLINLARHGECHSFCALLSSGLSPNPANLHGESLLHTVCRRGLHTVLACMLEKCGTSVNVADDYGRTPLHDAMWNNTVSLHTINLLLKHGDATALFFMQDARGALPLSYARKEHWPIWKDFIDKVKDQYWPVQLDEPQHEPSPLLLAPPHSHPLEDPIHALPLEVAVLVASGKMSPAEAVFLVDDSDDSECDDSDDDDDDMSEGSYDSDDDDCDSDDDDDSSTTSSWDEEMSDMLESLPIRK